MLVRHLIGYLPQQLSADFQLSGYENVWLFARLFDLPRREREPRVREVLAAMGLDDVRDRLVGTYSGGMIRRLELAQALVNRPALLVLDEPTIGLDPLARADVWERVQELRQETGMTVLLTTHYMEEADVLCDRVALMHHGRFRAEGTPSRAQVRARSGGDPRRRLPSPRRRRHRGRGAVRRRPRCPPHASHRAASRLSGPGRVAVLPPWWRLYPSRIVTFWLVELRKIRHDRTELYTPRGPAGAVAAHLRRDVQPPPRHPDAGRIAYLAYLSPGIMAQSALFIAIFFGIQIIWERDSGILTKLMATPTPRLALISGKAFAAGVRSVSQVVVILVLSAILQIRFDWNPLHLLGVAAAVVLGAAFFSCLSMTIAGIVLHRERLMGVGQAITMPLFFASNALYPVQGDARMAAGAERRQPHELRGGRPARHAARHPHRPPLRLRRPGRGRGRRRARRRRTPAPAGTLTGVPGASRRARAVRAHGPPRPSASGVTCAHDRDRLPRRRRRGRPARAVLGVLRR